MQAPQHCLTFGCFRFDRDRRRLFANGDAVALQGRAFDILEFLLDHRDRPVTRDEIVGAVWRGVNVTENNLAVQMSSLRRILAQYDSGELIITVPHRGYRFVGEVGPPEGSSQTPVTPRAAGLLPPPVESAPNPPSREAAWRPRWLAAIAACAVLVTGFVAWHAAGPANGPENGPAPVGFNPPASSVAVLAFANLSGDPAQDYLSDGLSEELIETLSRIRQVQVTARTSSFFFKGKSATVNDIAKTLNVATILEGSMRRQGDHVRIEARLTDARTGYEIWSHPFDSDLRDILKMEGDIAAAVADQLKVTLSGGDAPDLTAGGTTDARALDAYFHAERGIRQDNAAGTKAAIADYTTAIESDPKFALAYAAKAQALSVMALFFARAGDETGPARKLASDAINAADRAVDLAPRLGRTHIARAHVLANVLLDVREAWAEAQQAEILTPGDAAVDYLYGSIAFAAGQRNQGLDAMRRSVALDPLLYPGWLNLGLMLGANRNYDGAFDALQHAQTIAGQQTARIASYRGLVYIFMGKPQSAHDVCSIGADLLLLQCLAIADHALGHQQAATQAMQALVKLAGDNGAYNYTEIYAQWGQKEDALRWLAKAKTIRDSGLFLIKVDPLLDPIRQEPGFKAIEQSLNFPE